jgi:hypothetical protein
MPRELHKNSTGLNLPGKLFVSKGTISENETEIIVCTL